MTLPLIPIAGRLVERVQSARPRRLGLAAVAVAILMPLLLYLLSIPFGAGAIGMGDLKLLVGVGLLAGLVRTIVGVIAGTFLAGVVIVALVATRRITMRSYIPFGPFLILGAFWSVLVRFG